MRALVGFLVKKLGKTQVIDPVTKQDAVWELIDFFTQDKEFYDMSQMFPNSSV